MLKIKDLEVQYGARAAAVKHFDLRMKKGEIVSIVGESGSGKTTVIRAVLHALPPLARVNAAVMEFEGKSLSSMTDSQWRELRGTDISMIFQDSSASLNPIRRIGKQYTDYIRTHKKTSANEAAALAEEMLKKMRLPDAGRVMKSYPYQLSGGMCQRVGIAMAMTFQPKLLLADEPTSALDVTTQAQIVKQMIELRDIYGTSIIIVTHNLGVAAYMADQLIVMKNGRIEDRGAAKEVLTQPKSEYTKKLLQSVPEMEGHRFV